MDLVAHSFIPLRRSSSWTRRLYHCIDNQTDEIVYLPSAALLESRTRSRASHVVAPLLRNKSAGATLFDLTSSSFLKAVRRMLTLLGHKDANRCTLKPVRTGRATSLAAAGSPTGAILAAGEWTSSAFLWYCQADEVSVSAVLEVVC